MTAYHSNAEVRRETLTVMIAKPKMSSTHEQECATKSDEGYSVENENTIEKEEEAAESRSEAMKLVVRSPYWGRILKGKTRRNYDNAGIPGRPYRVIGCQAVLQAVEGQYWGCCPHHGKRVLELRECHFTDHFAGNWDLYMIGSSVTPTYVVHAFFMLPQNQTVIDLAYKIATQGWTYVGTANASVVRMDLEGMLCDILKQNDAVGFRYHHVHLEILMDQVFDRETPRSRKAAIEKSRSDRGSSNSSVVTPPSSTSIGEASSAATSPPIPNVVSHEPAWFPETNQGLLNVVPSHPVPHAWNPEAHFFPPIHPGAYGGHEAVQWYPASLGHHHMQSHLPGLPTMNQAQQLLHQGYVHGSNTVLTTIPSTYMTPGLLDPYHPSQSSYSAQNDHQSQRHLTGGYCMPSYNSLSQVPTPHQEDRDDGNEAVDRENLPVQADEKFDEDGATASFSETTADAEALVDDDDANSHRADHVA